jgi:UDP-GlcNAc:undecaprenyl-phosphate GlcNAc-1-phosphate transferase
LSVHIPSALIAACAALVVASALIPPIRRLALAKGVVATPRAERWSSRTTPYLGGVAIIVASLAIALVESRHDGRLWALVGASLAVGLVGVLDDLRPASIPLRLAVEIGASLVVTSNGMRVHIFPTTLDVAVSVIALVILVNAFNYIDNIDGALALVSVSISASITVAALLSGHTTVAIDAAAVLGACVGFTIFNWHPASIFMGDAGSLFLGFFLGALLFDLRLGSNEPTRALAIILTMSVPLFDMVVVFAARAISRRPLHVGGTDHTSHRLIRAGLPVRVTALILLLAAGISGSAAVAIDRVRIDARWAFAVSIAIVAPICILVLRLDDLTNPSDQRS